MKNDNIFIGKNGPLLIAEIGGNHEGNFEYAKKLCQLAIESGVDAIKFQIYTGDSLVSQVESPDRNNHFKKFELTNQQHIELAQMVKQAGLIYTSSVWDIEAMNWIDPYISFYKIGSGDLTAYPILEKTAAIGKPIILSTGLSTENEVLEAISVIQKINSIYKQPEYLAVLQCTSMYPIPLNECNLNVMSKLKMNTGLTIGYSDHSESSTALNYAVAMGAEILEFHYTDNREGKIFRDHKISLTNPEIAELIEEIKLINTIKGSFEKKPTFSEIENNHTTSFRRAVYLKEDISANHIIKEEDLIFLRPNNGIDCREWKNLIGMKSITPLKKLTALSFKQFS